MFGFAIYRIFIVVAVIGALGGYYYYTQNKIDALNQQVATKDFALKSATATIAQQQADIAKQAELLNKANADYQAARDQVADLQDKFNKDGRDFSTFVAGNPEKAIQHINDASKKSWRCIENTVNKEQNDGNC